MSKPIFITGVSNTQLSIARHYGGINYNGCTYKYIPSKDALVHEKYTRKATVKNWNKFLELVKSKNNEA